MRDHARPEDVSTAIEPSDRVDLTAMADTLHAQQAELAELRAELAAQAEVLARLRTQPRPGTSPVAAPVPRHRFSPQDLTGTDDAAGAEDPRVDRRRLLRSATVAAGAAVAGGAALSVVTASPAAAATITGSGNPGVSATGISGDGVVATTDTSGRAGVFAYTNTTGGIGVEAVFGSAVAAAGTAIKATTTTTAGARGVEAYGDQAVYGHSTGPGDIDSAGVIGRGDASITGVRASSQNGTGLEAISTAGAAVRAFGSHGVLTGATGATGSPLWINSTAPSPAGSTAKWYRGQFLVDTTGALWFNTTDFPSPHWVKVAGPTTAGAFHILDTPVRIYDSRPGQAPLGVTKGTIANEAERVIDANLGGGTIPAGGASAILVNLTVVGTTNPGFVALYTNGIAYPGTSSVNWTGTGDVVANQAVTAVDSSLRCKVRVANNCSTHFLIDLLGYWR